MLARRDVDRGAQALEYAIPSPTLALTQGGEPSLNHVPLAGRQRTSTAKVRVFDAATRAEIQRKKLAALEADNWVEDRPKDDDDDDEYNPLADADSGDGDSPNPACL